MKNIFVKLYFYTTIPLNKFVLKRTYVLRGPAKSDFTDLENYKFNNLLLSYSPLHLCTMKESFFICLRSMPNTTDFCAAHFSKLSKLKKVKGAVTVLHFTCVWLNLRTSPAAKRLLLSSPR